MELNPHSYPCIYELYLFLMSFSPLSDTEPADSSGISGSEWPISDIEIHTSGMGISDVRSLRGHNSDTEWVDTPVDTQLPTLSDDVMPIAIIPPWEITKLEFENRTPPMGI